MYKSITLKLLISNRSQLSLDTDEFNQIACLWLVFFFNEMFPIPEVRSKQCCLQSDRTSGKKQTIDRVDACTWTDRNEHHITLPIVSAHHSNSNVRPSLTRIFSRLQLVKQGSKRDGKKPGYQILSCLPAITLCLTGEIVRETERVDHVLLWGKTHWETIAIPAHEWSFNCFVFLDELCVLPCIFRFYRDYFWM